MACWRLWAVILFVHLHSPVFVCLVVEPCAPTPVPCPWLAGTGCPLAREVDRFAPASVYRFFFSFVLARRVCCVSRLSFVCLVLFFNCCVLWVVVAGRDTPFAGPCLVTG